MTPKAETLLCSFSSIVASHIAPDEKLNELKKKVQVLEKDNPYEASENLSQQAELLRKRGMVARATDEYLEKLVIIGLDPEYDFPYALEPVINNFPVKLDRRETEKRRAVVKKQDVNANTVLEVVKKENGVFKNSTILDVGLGILRGDEDLTNPNIISSAKTAVYNAKYNFQTAIKKAVDDGRNDPTLIESIVLDGVIGDIKPGSVGEVVGIMIEGNKRKWEKRYEKSKKKNTKDLPEIPSDPYNFVVNEGYRNLYRYLVKDYSDVSINDFIDNVLNRFGKRKGEKKEEKVKGKTKIVPKENISLTGESMLEKPHTSQGIEIILAGRITKGTFLDEVEDLLQVEDAVKLAEQNGWKHEQEEFEVEIKNSRLRALENPERQQDPVTSKEERQLNQSIKSMIYQMTSDVKSRRKWSKEIKKSNFSSVKFIYSLTGSMVNNAKMVDDFLCILFPDWEYDVNANGNVVAIRPVNPKK